MMNILRRAEWLGAFLLIVCSQQLFAAESLKVHGVFRSNMVLQRDKPITVWGWAPVGSDVAVMLASCQPTEKLKAPKGDGKWCSSLSQPAPKANG